MLCLTIVPRLKDSARITQVTGEEAKLQVQLYKLPDSCHISCFVAGNHACDDCKRFRFSTSAFRGFIQGMRKNLTERYIIHAEQVQLKIA